MFQWRLIGDGTKTPGLWSRAPKLRPIALHATTSSISLLHRLLPFLHSFFSLPLGSLRYRLRDWLPSHTLTATIRLPIMPIGSVPNDDPDAPNIRMNPFAVIVIMLTFLAFMFIMFSISYTFGHVIPTLCMIESPAAKAYMPVQARDGDAPPPYTGDDENETNDAELLLVQNQPLTSSIRATLKHLREKGGFWSRFRGLSVFLVWTFTRSLITNIVASPFTMSPGTYPYAFAFAAVVAETMLARLHLTWVQ